MPKQPSPISIIIFDLVGVLFALDTIALIRIQGITNIIRYLIFYRKSPITEIWDLLDVMRLTYPGQYQDTIMFQGHFLPRCICDWQAGIINNTEALGQLLAFVSYLDKQHYFKSAWHKEIITQLIRILADPCITMSAVKKIPRMYELVKKLKASHYRLFILTNIDNCTLEILQKKFPEFFTYFDGVITSAQTHILKPSKEIFTYLFITYDVDPAKCLFIDDQVENILTGESFGMHTLLYRSPGETITYLKAIDIL